MTIELIAGLDIGNGYTKGLIGGPRTPGERADVVDIPSSVAVMPRLATLRTPDNRASVELTGDVFNNLEAVFDSPAVRSRNRHVIGSRSLTSGGNLKQFDTVGRASKAQQPLSYALLLGVLAGKALRDHVSRYGTLPSKQLEVRVRLALALPMNEFAAHRRPYAAALTGGDATHRVTIVNFESSAEVAIVFEQVEVLPEGAAAQFAIQHSGDAAIRALIDDARSKGGPGLDRLSTDEVLALRDTVSIDVGEGTVGIIANSGGRLNADVSTALDQGYGSVLEQVVTNGTTGFTSRKGLAEFLQHDPEATQRERHLRAQQAVDDAAEFLVEAITGALGSVLRELGSSTAMVYVYGGGSGPLERLLRPALTVKVAEMLGNGNEVPVLYLDSQSSRTLNRDGLFLMAIGMAERAGQWKVA